MKIKQTLCQTMLLLMSSIMVACSGFDATKGNFLSSSSVGQDPLAQFLGTTEAGKNRPQALKYIELSPGSSTETLLISGDLSRWNLSFSLIQPPEQTSATLLNSKTGEVFLVVSGSATGQESFTYRVSADNNRSLDLSVVLNYGEREPASEDPPIEEEPPSSEEPPNNEPPSPPTSGGSYMGVPEFPWQPTYAKGTLSLSANTNCQGTVNNPAVIRGGNFNGDKITLSGNYCVLDGANIGSGRLLVSGQNIIIKNLTQSGHRDKSGVQLNGENILLESSHIHHNQGPDRHGVQINCGAKNIWVVENKIDYNGGQSIQFGHNCGSNGPDLIYIAGNTSHNNREAGMATKSSGRVVFSGNQFTGHRAASKNQSFTHDDGTVSAAASSGSTGTGIIMGADGATDFVAFFQNQYEDNAQCVRIEDVVDGTASAPNIIMIGEDCNGSMSNYKPTNPTGLYLEKHGGSILLLNSGFSNFSTAITGRSDVTNRFDVNGNGLSFVNVSAEFGGMHRSNTYSRGNAAPGQASIENAKSRFRNVMGHDL